MQHNLIFFIVTYRNSYFGLTIYYIVEEKMSDEEGDYEEVHFALHDIYFC